MASNGNGNGNQSSTGTISFRVNELEKDMRELWGLSRGLPERIAHVEKGQDELQASLTRLTMALVGFTLTVAGSSIAVLLAVGA